MRGKLFLVIILLSFSFVSAEFDYSVQYHNASDIPINVGGFTMSLQRAFSLGYLGNDVRVPTSNSVLNVDKSLPYHDTGEFYVLLDGEKVALQDAVNSLFESSYVNSDEYFPHSAEEIVVYGSSGSVFSLQELIDNNQYCKKLTCTEMGYNCGSYDDGCGNTLNCGGCSVGFCNSNGVCQGECVPGEVQKKRCGGDGNTCTVEKSKVSRTCASDGSWPSYPSCIASYKSGEDCTTPEGNIGECVHWDLDEDGRLEADESFCFYMEPIIIPNMNLDIRIDGGSGVLCTEFYNKGLIDEETYKTDIEFAQEHFSEDALKGYRSWGIPAVKVIRKNDEAFDFAYMMIEAFLEEVEYRAGTREEGNEIGALYLDEAVPLFERVGRHIDDFDYWLLFKDESLMQKSVRFVSEIFKKENPNNEIVENYFTDDKIEEMFYSALGDGTRTEMEYNEAFLEELEKAVEDIEELIKEANS